jgi:hypothetical protein
MRDTHFTAGDLNAWLTEGPDAAPMDLLASVLDEVDEASQRGPSRHWSPALLRGLEFSPGIRFAVAAVAVALVMVVSAGVLSIGSRVGSPQPSPTPSPTQLDGLPRLAGGSLAAGTYVILPVGGEGPSMTVSLPDGWIGCCGDPAFAIHKGSQTDPGMVGIAYWTADTVFADPCGHVPQNPAVGPSVAELAQALADLPSTSASEPVPTTFAGYPGKYLELTIATDLPCHPNGFAMWGRSRALRYAQLAGELDRLWILDVAGERVIVDVESQRATTTADREELDRVVATIRFHP